MERSPAKVTMPAEESDALLRLAVAAGNLGLWSWDLRTDQVSYSAEWKRQLGYRDREIGGSLAEWESRLHPEDAARVMAAVRAYVARPSRAHRIEFRLRHKDGSWRWILQQGALLRGARGAAQRLMGVHIDITERRRQEEQARETNRRLTSVLANLPGMTYRVCNDGHWTVEFISGRVEELTGYRADELMGPNPVTNPAEVLHAEDRQRLWGEILEAIKAGRSYTVEYRARMRDGAEKWLWERGFAVRDADGRIEAIESFVLDITERHVQRERIARLSRMRAVMSSINALIVRARSRAELFQEACRIAVEQGRFGLAWVAAWPPGGEAVPVAMYGKDGGLLANLRYRPERAAAPVAQGAGGVREGRPFIRNDLQGEPGPWQAALRELGYRSAASYPLSVGGQVIAVFNLYAHEKDFFDAEEITLLDEMSRDLSYALEFIVKDEQLDFLAVYDALTRLPNRNLFIRRLEGFAQAARGSGRPMAVVMLDIERFKAINDAIGHAGGDELLKVVGERLKFHAGGQSYMARIAGDRFAAVIPELDRGVDVEAAVKAGAWDRLDPPFRHGDNEFPVTFKIGVAVFPQDAGDPEALLRNAELALKHGRASGRSLTRYTAAMGDVAARKLTLERQLRQALERRELMLHYQPKLDLRTGLICGAEALLRWRSPDGAMVPPDVMIPLMEETGLIVDVGAWALAQALDDRAAWLADGLAAPGIAVNVSAAQVRESAFVEAVRSVLTAHGAAAAGLELEVTESMMMADPDANVAKLRTLRELGIGIALDDFGTGYSSLAYLARLPLNAVKVDRSFVARLADDRDTMTIVGAIVSLAHAMNLRVVAEGVETGEQLRFLQALRCDEIQGYLFSPALPAADFAALLRSGRKLH